MPVLTINRFGGIAPVVPPRYLEPHQAQIAINCPTWTGSLSAMVLSEFILAVLPKTGVINTIYRFGKDETLLTEDQYWFHWNEDVDVVRGFIAGDTTERTFFTGTDIPRATDNALALSGGTDYPVASRMLGVPVPTNELSAVATGTPDAEATTETRIYTYTIVNSWGEESAPYTGTISSSQVTVQSGQTVDITFPTVPGGFYDPQYRRLYRAVDGVFLLVYIGGSADIPVATTNVNDSSAPDELAEEIPSLTWLPPPADLIGLTELPNGVLAGFTGIDVYFSEPYRPFAWPVQYQQSMGYDIVGLGALDTTLVVLTKGKPYFIQGSSPDAMVVVKGDVDQACVSKESIVSLGGVVYYASPDGLVALAPNGSNVVTADRFDKDLWEATFKPESIKGYAYEERYHGFYDTGTAQGGFVYDPPTGEFTTHSLGATAGFTDLKTDTLYLITDSNPTRLEAWGRGIVSNQYTWRSKKFTYPDLVSFSCFRISAENYPISFEIYMDGVLHHSGIVPDGNIYRLPAGMGRDFEIELNSTSEVYRIQLATSPSEMTQVG